MDYEKKMEMLAEYVGANEPFPDELIEQSWLGKYKIVYRVWPSLFKEDELEFPVKLSGRPSHATTKSKAALQEMIDSDLEMGNNYLATQHQNVIGFEPVRVLGDALNKGLIHKERKFIEAVVRRYDYQQEVYLVPGISVINPENVLGYAEAELWRPGKY